MKLEEIPDIFEDFASCFHQDIYLHFKTMHDAVLDFVSDLNKQELETLDGFFEFILSGKYTRREVSQIFTRAGSSISFRDEDDPEFTRMLRFFKFVREQIDRRLAEENEKT